MRVVLLYNPASGRGKSEGVVHAAKAALPRARIDVETVAVGPGVSAEEIERSGAGATCVVVAGGDGTIHHTLPIAMRTGVPIYQLPMGTENLFARQFGMEASVERLCDALSRREVVQVDTASCNGRAFVLMCSVGFDANIVERVSAARTGTISRLDYVGHGIRELVAPRIPTLTVLVDGQPMIGTQPGMVVVANSRQYAARLDPAPEADMTDGLLDIVFFPGSTRVELGLWGVRAMLRSHTRAPDLVMARGKTVVLRAESPTPFQLDGEHGGYLHPQTTDHRELVITVQPGRLNVLLPGSVGGA